jgi:type I restriction enzyme R subunit
MSARILRDKHATALDKLIANTAKCLIEEATCFEDNQVALLRQLDLLAVNIQAVRQKDKVIEKVRSSEFWQSTTIEDLESARQELRGIMKYKRPPVGPGEYTPVTKTEDGDVHTSVREVQIVGADEAMIYRRRLKAILDDMIAANPTLKKIRQGETVDDAELQTLTSTILSSHPGVSLEVLNEFYGRKANELQQTVRELIGLDASAIEEHFKTFLHSHPDLTAQQVKFMNLLKNYITQHGSILVETLYDSPFTAVSHEGIDGVFTADSIEELVKLLQPFVRQGPEQSI